ncbi:lysophospholipid acyltransferase family protein [Gymnodinialimonas sp. 2305UL16-5]|uniref:lysophospholipid acyltransferase family protein n=1 Tax=Gymnodinialimonas mytili TaxID=3126503 RepID=UPI0030B3F322
MKPPTRRKSDWLLDRLWRGVLWCAMRLPYRVRLAVMGWLFRAIVGPATGRKAQALTNLKMIFPDMPDAERKRIASAVLDNVGRMVIESYTNDTLMERAEAWEPSGAGWPAVQAAQAEGRPILFITGHFGNSQAARALLMRRGYRIGALYRPLSNDFLNDHYVATLADMGGAFARDRRGLAGFMKHLRSGAQGAILIDQYVYDGQIIDFMGHPAPTSVAAAEMALKYNALAVPVYSTRLDNGLDFRIEFEDPIPHTDALSMTKAFNDSLSKRVFDAPEQWFWVHNRWKPERAEEAAAMAARLAEGPGR